MADLSEFKYPSSFKAKYLGVLVLAFVQFLGGAVHAIIGLGLLFVASGEIVYSVYTLIYGVFTVIFAYGLWAGKNWGWLGTIIISVFVIVVDVCAVLDVQLIPGVPKVAALGEITISLVFLVYLLQPKIVRVFKQTN